MVKVATLHTNPNNPRVIKDIRFIKLCESIRKFPKMMTLRPIVINKDRVVLAGNQRLAAIIENGMEEIPDNWVKKASDLSKEEQDEFIIRDNVHSGAWDYDELANKWDDMKLNSWDLEIPDFNSGPNSNSSDMIGLQPVTMRIVFPDESVMKECEDQIRTIVESQAVGSTIQIRKKRK